MRIEKEIAKKLLKNKLHLSIAESCTGGLVSSRITDIPGSSGHFLGGITAYSNKIKTDLLDVPVKTIKKYGAVSRQTAKAMAEGVKLRTGADISAAITGIAGPTGGSEEKPVGTAYIAVTTSSKKRTKKVFFKGDRSFVKGQFAEAVLSFIADNV
ncbi:MAG: CinA family protein [Candidatus Omnitrophica bacterium]|nr:CinA family protein [Candidatus Omnitrophota bacterium]